MVIEGKDFYVNLWKGAGDDRFHMRRLSTHGDVVLMDGNGDPVTIKDGSILVVVEVDHKYHDLFAEAVDLGLGNVAFLGGLLLVGTAPGAKSRFLEEWDVESSGDEEIPF